MTAPPTADDAAADDTATGERPRVRSAAKARLWLAGQFAIIAALSLSLVTLRFAAAQHRAPDGLTELARWIFQSP